MPAIRRLFNAKISIIPIILFSLIPLKSYAVDQMRRQLPIVAGTEINVEPEGLCTVGLVLKNKKWSANLTSYQRSVRYAVTAGHCGELNADVTVGDEERREEVHVGKVTWKSSSSDLALIRIEPRATRIQHCSSSSTGPHCVINIMYHPRAVGKVIMPSLRTRTTAPVPVTGIGSPADNETFCSSGAISNVICSWTKQPPPSGWMHPRGNLEGATSRTESMQLGDSGGPVVRGLSGVIYGIMSYRQLPADPNLPFIMGYTRADQLFNELPSYYGLAPS